jgi:hypothetical protein
MQYFYHFDCVILHAINDPVGIFDDLSDIQTRNWRDSPGIGERAELITSPQYSVDDLVGTFFRIA